MDIAQSLTGGDRRSIGRSNDVVSYVQHHKSALPELVAALTNKEAVVRMRAADVLEKSSASHAEWLGPFAQDIMIAAAERGEKEICWHAAQILPRLELDALRKEAEIDLLFGFLDEESRILRAFALTGLVQFAQGDRALRERVMPLVRSASKSGVPSLEARAKKLRKQLGKEP